MKVLVVGNGAREHVISWKLSQILAVDHVYTAPGNAGTQEVSENVSLEPGDVDGLLKFASSNGVDLTVVGPEAPLEAGIVDRFRTEGLLIFGPTKSAARIETSKVFAKDIMVRYGVPTGAAVTFTDYRSARDYLSSASMPLVIKADGLAAGKGVFVAHTREQACAAIYAVMQESKLGSAGDRILIEEHLEGQELSVFAFSDGYRISSLFAAQDYKRVGDGDSGPNTGGMGSHSPPIDSLWNEEIESIVRTSIMEPIIEALGKEGCPYSGVLYAGLMVNGVDVKVIEFNCRFGDPESQVVLPRLKTNLLDVMLAVSRGDISNMPLVWDHRYWVGVVLASGGYPDSYGTGFEISGLGDLDRDVVCFHAGTISEVNKKNPSQKVLTSGGRVITVAAPGDTVHDARNKAYRNVKKINFQRAFYRSDIADFE